MANPEHVEVVRQGAEAIDRWREANPGVCLDLSGADLRAADLAKASLLDADFRKTKLVLADFTEAPQPGELPRSGHEEGVPERSRPTGGDSVRGETLRGVSGWSQSKWGLSDWNLPHSRQADRSKPHGCRFAQDGSQRSRPDCGGNEGCSRSQSGTQRGKPRQSESHGCRSHIIDGGRRKYGGGDPSNQFRAASRLRTSRCESPSPRVNASYSALRDGRQPS